MDNKETVKKLTELNSLLIQHQQKQEYVESGCAYEAANDVIRIKKQVSALPGIPTVANAMPVFPSGEQDYIKAKEEAAQSSKITKIVLIAVAVSILLLVITKWTIFSFLTVAAGVVWFILHKNDKNSKQSLKKKEKAYHDSLEASQASFAKFRKALSCYEQEVEDGIAAAKEFGQFYREKFEEYENILLSFSRNLDNATMELSSLSSEIENHNYIPEEYHHLVPKLISLLQSGRADSYKEALNMAIDEERQDAMEAARQQEEARRLSALERQAEEEHRHNMMMERQQAAHERAMERAAQEQADIQRRAAAQAQRDAARANAEARRRADEDRRNAAKQANATRMAGVSKCASCANSRRCPSSVKESGAGLTCGGYRPY